MKLWLIIILSAVCLFPSEADETVNFLKNPLRITNNRHNIVCQCSATAVEQNKGTILSWQAVRKPFSILELALRNPVLHITNLENTEIILSVHVGENTRVQAINLRFLDASGEYFQFRSAPFPLRGGKAGIQQIRYQINPKKKYESWGGNKNGKYDWPLRFQGFGCELLPGSGTLTFLSLEIRRTDSDLACIKVELETGHPLRLIRPGETVQPRIRFKNTSGQTKQFTAALSLENFQGEKTPFHFEFTLSPGEEKTAEIQVPAEGLGIWYVDYILAQTGKTGNISGRRSFIRLIPSGPVPYAEGDFRFGICSHPERVPEEQQKLEALAAGLIGANFLRLDAEWGSIQRHNAMDWDTRRFDKLIEIFGERHIELMPILGYTPYWAVAKDWKPFYPGSKKFQRPDYSKFAAWAEKLASHTRGKIRYFEVWNEPELGFANFSPDEYIELQKHGFKGVKQGNPDAIVSTAGFAYYFAEDRPPKPGLMRRALTEGRGSYDLVAFHGHQSFQCYRDQILPMKQMFRQQNITVPWIPNETGLTSVGGVEPEQAYSLFQKLIFSWAEGAPGYNWYDLRNDGFDPLNREHNFGMLTRDFYPKAVYAAYNTITSLFRHARFEKALDFGKGVYAYLFRTPDGMLLPGWNEPGCNPALTVLKTDASKAERIDLMGNAKQLVPENGRLLLMMGAEPSTFRFDGASFLQVEGELVRITAGALEISGQKTMLELELFNPFDETREFTVSGGKEHVKVLLQSKARHNIRVSALPKNGSVQLTCRIGQNISGTFTVPLQKAKLISAAYHTASDFRLNQASQRHELYPGNPFMQHMHWKGPKDLSANIRLWYADGKLILDAEVTDDIHHQPHSGENVWQGDNVQVALQFPGEIGCWEIGFTRLADGQPEIFVWRVPHGRKNTLLPEQAILKTTRSNHATTYHAELPLQALGVDMNTLRNGFLFGLLVNDNDGKGRKGWMQTAPGLGDRKDTSSFTTLVLR